MYRTVGPYFTTSGRFMYRRGGPLFHNKWAIHVSPRLTPVSQQVGDTWITHSLPKPPTIPRTLSSSSCRSVPSVSNATTSVRLRISVIFVFSLCGQSLQPPFVIGAESMMNY